MTTPGNKQAYLYPRLSSFYFFFFATLGAFVPYWSVYLKSLNFSPAEIGELMAIVMASKLVAPYLLGWISDHFQKSLFIIQIALIISVVTFSGVFFEQSYWWLALVMVTFGFAWNATLPLFEALTLNHLEGDTHHYSLIRLWGSIGFIILVAGLPIVIPDNEISKLPIIVIGLLIANTISTLFITEKKHSSTHIAPISISPVLQNPVVIGLLIACAFQAISHGAYYTFFSIYLEENGYSRSMTGWMWAIGVMAEVALFLVMHKLLQHFKASWLFAIALLVTALRWLVLAFWVDNMTLLILSQLLHAASFGLFHAASIYLIHDLFPGRLQMRGQALYAGISFGLGGSLGNLLSGYTWESLGSTGTFLLSSLLAFIGAMIAFKYVNNTSNSDATNHS